MLPFSVRVQTAIILFTIVTAMPLPSQQRPAGGVGIVRPTLDINSVRVQIRPELEFVLPYGIITQQAQLNLGQTRITTSADFDVPSASISGRLGISRRFTQWEPRIQAYQSSNAEGIIKPQISDGRVQLLPEKRYLERNRGLVSDITYHHSDQTTFTIQVDLRESISSVLVDDSLQASPQSQQFEILPTASIQFTSLEVEQPDRSMDLIGNYLRLALVQKFVRSLTGPVALHGRFGTLWNLDANGPIRFEVQVSGSTPLVVWSENELTPVRFGGFDTIRGIEGNSVSAVRGLLARTTTIYAPVEDLGIGFDTPVIGQDETIRIRLHNPKLLVAFDAAMTQAHMTLDSPVSFNAGAGPGLSITVSANDSAHFDVRAFFGWSLAALKWPVFYLQGSLFSLASR